MSKKNAFYEVYVLPRPSVAEKSKSFASRSEKDKWKRGFDCAKKDYRRALASTEYKSYRESLKNNVQHLQGVERDLMKKIIKRPVVKISRHDKSNEHDHSYIVSNDGVYKIEKSNDSAQYGATSCVKFAYDKNGRRYCYITKEGVSKIEKESNHLTHKKLNMTGFMPRSVFSTNTGEVKRARGVDADITRMRKADGKKHYVTSKNRGVLPYMGVTLKSYLDDNQDLNNYQRRVLARMVLEAIVRFEKKTGMIHRDLALDNICIDSNFNVRLIDFESCINLKYGDSVARELYGKPAFLPVELESVGGAPATNLNQRTHLQLKNFAVSKVIDKILNENNKTNDLQRMNLSVQGQIKKLTSSDLARDMEMYLDAKQCERRMMLSFFIRIVKNIFFPRNFLSINKSCDKVKAAIHICELFSPGARLDNKKIDFVIEQIKRADKNSRFIRCVRKLLACHQDKCLDNGMRICVSKMRAALESTKRRSFVLSCFFTKYRKSAIAQSHAGNDLSQGPVMRCG